MSIAAEQKWLVSCPNRGGGVFLVDGHGVERLSMVETTGMAIHSGGVLWARQSEGGNRLRRLADGHFEERQLAGHELDLHDLLLHDGYFYAALTELNAVASFDDGLREIERWTLPGERDASHLNSLCFHEGRLLATRFCASERRRGYKDATRGAGEVIDVQTQEVLLTGLSQPHSLTSHDGLLWLCDSETRTLRAYRDYRQVAEHAFEGYTRGLSFGDDCVVIGVSRSRNDPAAELDNARLIILDVRAGTVRSRIDLPADEIYDICPFDGDAAALRRAVLMESHAEIARYERARSAFESELVERDRRLTVLNDSLHRMHQRYAASEAHVADVLSREATLAASLESAQAQVRELQDWTALLEPLLAQSAALGAVLRSRWWRYTKPLRALPALLGWRGRNDIQDLLRPFEGPSGVATVDRSALPIHGLDFPQPPDPLVSIVVTSYGRFAETRACLAAIRGGAGPVRYEVILIEDASAEPEMARFRHVPGLRYQENPANLGYLRSANQAHALARGDYIHFLNNDTLVQPGWLEGLLSTFARFHDCGLAGSKLLYPDGRQQEAGGIVWSDASGCNIGRDDDPQKPEYAYAHEVDYVSGASLMLRADVFRHLGGFDQRYAPAYYEDTDLAFRVRAFGLKAYFQPASVVVHQEGLSHGTDPDSGIKAVQSTNRSRFLERWNESLERQQLPPGAHPFLARDRTQLTRSVLLVDRFPPRTDRDAGSRAIWQLMRVLQLNGLSLKFWAHDPDFDPVYADNLRAHGIELLAGDGAGEDFKTWIAGHGRYLDYVILSRPTVASEYIDAVRAHSVAKVIYYGHDIHSLRFVSQRRVDPDPLLAGFAHHARLTEERLWRDSDLVLYPAEAETRHVRTWLRENGVETTRAETVPLFAYEPIAFEVGGGLAHRRNVLFVGGFAHAPNEDGAIWFARHVWPIVHAEHPECRLCLVGAEPSDAVAALGRSDVLVTGHVPEHELVAYYHSARAVVAPLRFGAGVKGKVLEAMRYGVPCVTTSIGAQGLEDARFLRVSDDVEETARLVVALLRDDDAWMQAAREGMAFIEERYSVASVWRTLAKVIDPTPYADVAARLCAVEAGTVAHDEESPAQALRAAAIGTVMGKVDVRI